MIDRALLTRLAADYEITVSPEAAERLDVYAELLAEWNQKMNLTAITDPYGMVLKHFVDSLTALSSMPEGPFSLIDVGTGAGFPGIPLAVLRPDMRLTLLDSLQKRLTFLDAVTSALGIPCTLVHARAEDAAQKAEYREKFDVATARAVAALPVLSEYCLPFVKVGGRFVAMKGREAENEIAASRGAIKLLGGRIQQTKQLLLPLQPAIDEESYERYILCVQKESPTPAKYPRSSAKIAKTPL